jgi:hypothetical protein
VEMATRAGFTPDSIASTFAGCAQHHAVLAFSSLFAAFDLKPLGPSPPGWQVCTEGACPLSGLTWLDQHALPALLKPSYALDDAASQIVAALRHSPGKGGGRDMACAHIRRGDFVEECAKYDAERLRKDARPWVRWHHQNGWGCLQTEAELALNLQAARSAQAASGHPSLAVYASIEDASQLATMPSLRRFNISTLATFEKILRDVHSPLPPALTAILVDQLTCSRAQVLLLNAYSTFSQLVMGRIGLTHADALGWVRDLTRKQQHRLDITVIFWRREDPLKIGHLVPLRS